MILLIQILLIISLISLAISSFANIYATHKVWLYNFESYKRSNEALEKHNKKLQQEIEEAQAVLVRLTRKGIDDTAFAITTEGVKLLPKDWKNKWYR